jgi:hypothetical protein
MSVNVKFTGDAADLLAKQKQVADGAAKITDQYKATGEELTRLRRVAKQVWDETTSAQEKYNRRMDDLNKLLKEGKINQEQFAKASELAAAKLGNVSTKQGAIRQELSGMVMGYASVGTAIGAILGAYDDWSQRNTKVAKQTTDLAVALRSFASLEGMDQKFLQQAINVTRGEIPLNQVGDLTQSVFSASGDKSKTLDVLKLVADASKAGIPSDLGQELAIQALAQNLDPGQLMRGAFAAGAAGKRSPLEVARAAPSLEAADDKMFGIAVAAKIAETRPLQVKEYTEGALKALSGVSGAAGWFKQQGLTADATQAQRLAAMNKAGVDTAEELTRIGITEDVGRRSLVSLLSNYQNLMQLEQATRTGAMDVNLLDKRIAEGDAAFPAMSRARLMRAQEALMIEDQSFNTQAQEDEFRMRAMGRVVRQRGGLMASNVGEDGKLQFSPISNPMGTAAAANPMNAIPALMEMMKANREVSKTLNDLKRGTPSIPKPEN